MCLELPSSRGRAASVNPGLGEGKEPYLHPSDTDSSRPWLRGADSAGGAQCKAEKLCRTQREQSNEVTGDAEARGWDMMFQ